MASYQHRPDRNLQHSCVYRGQDGKQKRESFRTKQEANLAVARRTLDERRWRLEGPDDRPQVAVPTVGEWFDEWFAQYDRAWKTRRKRQSTFDHWIRPEIASKALDQVTPRDVVQMVVRSRDARRHATTEAAIHTLLNLMYDHAIRMGVVSENPVAALDKPRGHRRRQRTPRPLTEQEFEKLVAQMSHPYDALATLMYAQGLRPSEACALEARHVGDRLTVEQAVKGDDTIGPTKTEHTRRLPLAKRTLAALDGCPRRGRLFPDMTERQFREQGFEPAAKGAGLTDRVPYDLRHSAATRLLRKGATIRQVMAFMGHADLKTTALYLHLLDGDMDDLPLD